MRITEFNKQITAKLLNESAAATFGQKLNLESFSMEQLQDARNKLRTKVSQLESTEHFDSVYNESFQKNKLFLDILNQEISERESSIVEFTEMEQLVLDKVTEGLIEFDQLPMQLQEKAKSKAQQKFMGMVYSAKKGEKAASPAVKKAAQGMSKKAAHDYAATKHKGKPEHVKEGFIFEGEEERAELIMSARDMVDRITGWMEDTANMQAESMLELVDSIRDELGQQMGVDFESVVKPALAAIYATLENSRQELTKGVSILTGENEPTEMMGEPETDLGAEPDLGSEIEPGMSPEPSDEFAADAAAVGGPEVAGRPTRESIEYSSKLGMLLAQKKK